MVGRPRQFDEGEVLDAAMQAFWANGYEATSMADLMSVTGLHKGSLYQAFGDKHRLFVASLRNGLWMLRPTRGNRRIGQRICALSIRHEHNQPGYVCVGVERQRKIFCSYEAGQMGDRPVCDEQRGIPQDERWYVGGVGNGASGQVDPSRRITGPFITESRST